MLLPPWLIWIPALALVNFLIFVAIRGRWGGYGGVVLFGASALGVIVGDAAAGATDLEILRIGDMNVVGASLTAQAFMVVVTLLSALGPIRVEDG